MPRSPNLNCFSHIEYIEDMLIHSLEKPYGQIFIIRLEQIIKALNRAGLCADSARKL